MRLTDEQLADFGRDGFLNAGRVFSEGELAEIGGEYDRLVTADSQTLGNDRDGRYPYRAMMQFRSPALRSYINHPELIELGLQLVGPDLRCWWDQGINKSPGAGSHIDWHQDNGYQSGSLPEYLTFWLALDDSNLENGGLLVVPGSQATGLRAHELRGVHWVISDIDESGADEPGAVSLEAKAGELLVFSSMLVHKTVGNHSADRQRRAWVIQYAPGDASNDETGEVYDNRAWVARDGQRVEEPWSERRFDLARNALDEG